jgi:hypothetical protein
VVETGDEGGPEALLDGLTAEPSLRLEVAPSEVAEDPGVEISGYVVLEALATSLLVATLAGSIATAELSVDPEILGPVIMDDDDEVALMPDKLSEVDIDVSTLPVAAWIGEAPLKTLLVKDVLLLVVVR